MKSFLVKHITSYKKIERIRGEASTRQFFRITEDQASLVAMVYPQEEPDEIHRILHFTSLFRKFNIPVPIIRDVVKNRIILMEDVGNTSLQRAFQTLNNTKKKRYLKIVSDLLARLKRIPLEATNNILGHERMRFEMEFFLTHFVQRFTKLLGPKSSFRDSLYNLALQLKPIDIFAHRDFHSRNMFCFNDQIYLVDFQDSLVAPPYYDLASFAFDSYLDLKSLREYLYRQIESYGQSINRNQLHLIGLQRNIKALGTFGYQIYSRKNLSYKKYIPRTIRHINIHLCHLKSQDFIPLADYFTQIQALTR